MALNGVLTIFALSGVTPLPNKAEDPLKTRSLSPVYCAALAQRRGSLAKIKVHNLFMVIPMWHSEQKAEGLWLVSHATQRVAEDMTLIKGPQFM